MNHSVVGGRVEEGRGGLGHAATLRFPFPLISRRTRSVRPKPDVRVCRIQLSDRLRGRHTAATDRRRLRLAIELVRKAPDLIRSCEAHRQSPRSSPSWQARLKSGAFAPPALPGLDAPTPLSDSPSGRHPLGIALRRQPRPRGSPPITRIALPTCRAHYPGEPNGCMCRCLPRSRGLPR